MTASAPPSAELEAARAAVWPFIRRLAGKPEVEGVLIISSAAVDGGRVTFDRDSDLDLTVFVGVDPTLLADCGGDPAAWRSQLRPALPGWLPDFSFHVPVPWGSLELNVHQRILQCDADPRTGWNAAMAEAHHDTVEIAFDRSGAVHALLKAKTARDPSHWRRELVRLTARLEWDIRRLPERQLRRGDPVTAHYMLGAAVEELIEVLHAATGRFTPHRKWQLRSIRAHALASDAELELLAEGLRCADFSTAEFERRVAAIGAAWAGIRRRMPADLPADAYRFYNAHVSANRQLLTTTLATRIEDRFGACGPVRDLVNFLLPADEAELLAALRDPDTSLPESWQPTAVYLAAELAGAHDDAH